MNSNKKLRSKKAKIIDFWMKEKEELRRRKKRKKGGGGP